MIELENVFIKFDNFEDLQSFATRFVTSRFHRLDITVHEVSPVASIRGLDHKYREELEELAIPGQVFDDVQFTPAIESFGCNTDQYVDDLIQDMESRIEDAIDYAVKYGSIDGAHHKDWVIDQMVRALTGCPMITETAKDVDGKEYSCKYQGESEEYKTLVKEACDGEDGPDTYEWDVGVPP